MYIQLTNRDGESGAVEREKVFHSLQIVQLPKTDGEMYLGQTFVPFFEVLGLQKNVWKLQFLYIRYLHPSTFCYYKHLVLVYYIHYN